ncbi:exodeoxyribonuclease III [Thorsellia anophelis]|uniref:Exodeoxyribonuclease III n=1 Tax=Thorsellia anophelis DSM 18579 TaxID=1123402 RepID=A0A1I0BIG1_9GAMM|nr:exodeoxyribonuclease III [Thorsellia anophelis]SET06675.1 Exodeoxyribonuclease III [Thorsellia anophelis DSM 18579]
MKIVSFNINSIRARLHQLSELIATQAPDIIGLQETKVHDDLFPKEEIEALGYHVIFHGQKAHYGVAMLSKLPPMNIQKGFPSDDDEAQRRMIMAQYDSPIGKIKVLNGYFPQGESRLHETKFPAKEKFYRDLMSYLDKHCSPEEKLVIMGDFNISPEDIDIGIGEENRKRWLRTGKCSFLPEEREWLNQLKNWGLKDCHRIIHPEQDNQYSWFDYRSKGFDDNRGLRIDYLLATNALTAHLAEVGIDYELRSMDKPSDHAPVWARFK